MKLRAVTREEKGINKERICEVLPFRLLEEA